MTSFETQQYDFYNLDYQLNLCESETPYFIFIATLIHAYDYFNFEYKCSCKGIKKFHFQNSTNVISLILRMPILNNLH
jgi:hypothetical protein